jgi:cell pole-organizing protein PopZ
LTTADVKTEQEPSIEEILEAIRQIISDDNKGDAKPAASAPAPAKPATAAPQPQVAASSAPAPRQPQPQAQVQPKPASQSLPPLNLTEKIEFPQEPEETPAPQSPMTIEMMDSPMTDEVNDLISAQTAAAVTDSLSKLLAGNVSFEKEDEMGRPGKVTLEEMTRALMKPMIRSWLDQNLPGIIEKIVQREVEKLARRAMER